MTRLQRRPASRLSRPRGGLANVLASIAARAAAGARAVLDKWRSSLKIRVVCTTMAVSAVVVSLLGFFLMQQIASNLLASKKVATYSQAKTGLSIAESDPGVFRPPGPGAEALMKRIAASLKSNGVAGAEYGIAVTVHHGPPVYDSAIAYGLKVGDLPAGMKATVQSDTSVGPQFRYWSMGTGSHRQPGLLFASQFGSGYALWYFFPLTSLQGELSLIERLLALVGVALVFLLAGIAWLVTRWVVKPVATAAEGAQLLSTGRLDERLAVRGNDEIAALARSFNDMAASLQDKMRELQELSQVQRQFVSDVSHELRTPLTTIRMAADLLFEAREQLDTSASRSAELLQGQLERFESLLGDLLEISRYDANAATLEAEPTDLCDVVRNSADVAQQLAERRGSRIEFRLPAEPCLAEMDRRRVERILRNLLVNAVEHGEGKDVLVTSAADRDAVAVAVRDFGVGLSPGEDRLVFDRFWRADPARARATGGTGLGLSIALEDARLHGGWLEAWGEPGRGSVFRLTLPRAIGTKLAGSPLPLSAEQVDVYGMAQPLAAPIGADGHAAMGVLASSDGSGNGRVAGPSASHNAGMPAASGGQELGSRQEPA